jgi:hypothetical protein
VTWALPKTKIPLKPWIRNQPAEGSEKAELPLPSTLNCANRRGEKPESRKHYSMN